MTLDPRIEAAARTLDSHPWDELHDWHRDAYRAKARVALAAADAVDPLRVSLPPNPRQTRAGIAPAGTPTKRIWPEP